MRRLVGLLLVLLLLVGGALANGQERFVLLKMKIVRVEVGADGERREGTVQSPALSTIEGKPASVSVTDRDKQGKTVGGWTVEVLPRANADGTVTLAATLRQEGPKARSAKARARVTAGETIRITGLTDSPDRAVRKAVGQGKALAPAKDGPVVAHYLDITATTEP